MHGSTPSTTVGSGEKERCRQPAGNFFFDPSGKSTVGFYPFNAQVWDIYYDYYAWKNVRFRLGYMDFLYTKHDKKDGENFSFWEARNSSMTTGRILRSMSVSKCTA